MNYIRCDLIQGSQEWHDWRSGGIGSSDVSVLLGINPYKTIWDIWAERFGFISNNLDRNPLVRDGKKYEGVVRNQLSTHFKQKIDVFCAYAVNHIHRRASFDGVIDGNVPVEIKVVSNPVWKQVESHGKKSEAFELYYPQVCYQMGILGAQKGYLAFYNIEENRIKLFNIDRTDSVDMFIDEIFELVDNFFTDNILKKIEPTKDNLRDDYIPDESEMHEYQACAVEFYDLVKQEMAAKKIYLDLKEQRSVLTKKLASIAATFKSINLFGVRIVNRKRSYNIDYEAFLEAKGIVMTEEELAKYSSLSKPSLTIHPVENNIPKLRDKVLNQKALEAKRALQQ